MLEKKNITLYSDIMKLLVDDCLDKVRKQYVIGEKISVRQLFGFGGTGDLDFSKPTLKKMIENDIRVLTRSREGIKVNIKYFYDKYRHAKRPEKGGQVILEGYHTWIYFEFLGFSDLEGYIRSKRERGLISEVLFLKQEAIDGGNSEHKKGEGKFLCYHYSRLWNGIFSFELILDFDSIEYKNHFPVYDVTSVSRLLNGPQDPVTSFGKAYHRRGNLIIEVEDKLGGVQKMIFSIQSAPDKIERDTVFLGSYVGISQNSDIISGTICLVKKQEENQKIPMQIERYLFLDKWQKRIPLEPQGYLIQALPLHRDREDLLKEFFGNYRFCWLDSGGKRLIESQLTINKNYEFFIKTFMSENGLYSGRIFVRDNVVCLNSIGLRDKMPGKNLSASVFFDIKHIPKRKLKKWTKGVFILAGVTRFPKFGFCLIEKMEDLENLEPTIHEESDIKRVGHLNKIFIKLKEMSIKESRFLMESVSFQDSVTNETEEY